MSDLTAARVQMELSLAFHMVFAAVGMAMPLMMLIAGDAGCAPATPTPCAWPRRGPR